MEQIARRAGVSKSAVFAAVGNKQTLLKTVRDVALAGDDGSTPVRDRPSAERARAAPDIGSALDAVAAHIAAVHERSAPVEEVLRGAAAGGEPELRDLSAAADILSLFMASDAYTWLVSRCGWSTDDYANWLRASLATQLLPAVAQ